MRGGEVGIELVSRCRHRRDDCGDVHAIVDAGPFGALHSGHSHSDTLSIVLRSGGEEILIDPGTYTYTGEPEWRDWFRGASAHNTIRIDGRDQASWLALFVGPTSPKSRSSTGRRIQSATFSKPNAATRASRIAGAWSFRSRMFF
jgi:hypothetical protein